MDRVERFDFQTSVEAFLEENKVYELFETLLKDIIAKRPKDPLDFLIDKLSKP
jgi:adenylate kinase